MSVFYFHILYKFILEACFFHRIKTKVIETLLVVLTAESNDVQLLLTGLWVGLGCGWNWLFSLDLMGGVGPAWMVQPPDLTPEP